jgi:hypothetical protein
MEEEIVFARASQYDFKLVHFKTHAGQAVYEWCWPQGHEHGPGFVDRRQALEWMADWLDRITPDDRVAL